MKGKGREKNKAQGTRHEAQGTRHEALGIRHKARGMSVIQKTPLLSIRFAHGRRGILIKSRLPNRLPASKSA